MVTFRFRPVLQLKCGLAFAASKLRLTVSAYQAMFSSLGVGKFLLVETEAAVLFQTLFALVRVVPARRVSSFCTVRAYEIPVRQPVMLELLIAPRACVKHVLASRAPVAVACQALFPDIIAFDTTLAQ